MKNETFYRRKSELIAFGLSSPLNIAGLVVVAGLLLIALCAPLIAPYDPHEVNPIERLSGISFSHPMGTDNLGRDVLSRIIYGARTALFVGIIGALVASSIGLTLGIIAAYSRSLVDNVILLIFDVLRAFPSIILILVIVSAIGPSLGHIVLALGITIMPGYGRAARARALSVREEDYVKAAEAMGATRSRIIRKHISKNVAGPLIIMAGMDVGYFITLEAGLSFLGLGVPPPMASWGNMLRVGFEFALKNPLMLIWPCIALFISVAGFSLLAEALRNYLDPAVRRSM